MDLKRQLVIWKRCDLIVDRITFTTKLEKELARLSVVDGDAINKIMLQKTNTEKNIKLVDHICESSDSMVFEKFVLALKSSDFKKVAEDLERTFNNTHLGEQLPPALTYFQNLSEFLRMYPHISIKLGEEQKCLVENFISGKLKIFEKKIAEEVQMVRAEKQSLEENLKVEKLKNTNLSQQILNSESSLTGLRSEKYNLKSVIRNLEEKMDSLTSEVLVARFYAAEQAACSSLIQAETNKINSLLVKAESFKSDSQLMEKHFLENLRLDHMAASTYIASLSSGKIQKEINRVKECMAINQTNEEVQILNKYISELETELSYWRKVVRHYEHQYKRKVKKEKSTDCDSALIPLLCVHG